MIKSQQSVIKKGIDRRAFFASAAALPLTAVPQSKEQFDFDTPYNRFGTDCIKWDAQERHYGKGSIVAGMGISDSDFRTAPVITRALAERMKHENWGYFDMPQSFAEAIIGWNKRRYGIEIHPDRLMFSPGVHPSMTSAIKAFSSPGSKVLLMTPTYDGFLGDIGAAGCKPEKSPLKQVNGRYQMDLEELDRHISHDTNCIILCNPNNPTGNVWSREDLLALGELCLKRRVVVLADEIHCDFVNRGHKYTPFSTLPNREVVMNSITFKSASKSFGTSAMKCSWFFSENADYLARVAATGHNTDINTLGVIAARAALTEGEEYLNQQIAYIDGNHDFVESFMRENIPLIKYQKAEGTFLAWLDVSQVMEKMPGVNLQEFFVRKAKVQINAGANYGPGGEKRMRMNIATSRRTIELALRNLAAALS